MSKPVRFVLFMCVLLAAACVNNPPPYQQPTKYVPPPAPVPLARDAKEATAYIEVKPPEELRNLFLGLANKSNIKPEYRNIFMAYATSAGSGSGFIVTRTGTDGSLVVTNRHVVVDSDNAAVSFDGGQTLIKGKILYIDSYYDLAVLEIPGNLPGLRLASSYNELDDVFAMGYPGLGQKGSFQATRGSISKRCLQEDNSERCWIQHTATIDPGSSGGPLMKSGNEVVGVNSGFLTGRHDVFLAVPSEAVQEAVKQAEEIRHKRTDKVWMTSQLKDACFRFVSELSASDIKKGEQLVAQLSHKIVSQKGLAAYQMVLNESFLAAFQKDPFTTMELAILNLLRTMFVANEGISMVEHCDRINPSDNVLDPNDDVRITINFHNGEQMQLSWLFERGAWRLSDF